LLLRKICQGDKLVIFHEYVHCRQYDIVGRRGVCELAH
jgi:hypothetical protein